MCNNKFSVCIGANVLSSVQHITFLGLSSFCVCVYCLKQTEMIIKFDYNNFRWFLCCYYNITVIGRSLWQKLCLIVDTQWSDCEGGKIAHAQTQKNVLSPHIMTTTYILCLLNEDCLKFHTVAANSETQHQRHVHEWEGKRMIGSCQCMLLGYSDQHWLRMGILAAFCQKNWVQYNRFLGWLNAVTELLSIPPANAEMSIKTQTIAKKSRGLTSSAKNWSHRFIQLWAFSFNFPSSFSSWRS